MIGDALAQIFNGAFSPEGIAGGAVGVLVQGFRRAAFSNEAGIGSASIAHSAVKQNMQQVKVWLLYWSHLLIRLWFVQ